MEGRGSRHTGTAYCSVRSEHTDPVFCESIGSVMVGIRGVGCLVIIHQEFLDGLVFVVVRELDRGFVIAHFALTGKLKIRLRNRSDLEVWSDAMWKRQVAVVSLCCRSLISNSLLESPIPTEEQGKTASHLTEPDQCKLLVKRLSLAASPLISPTLLDAAAAAMGKRCAISILHSTEVQPDR